VQPAREKLEDEREYWKVQSVLLMETVSARIVGRKIRMRVRSRDRGRVRGGDIEAVVRL
jgi:hypothetical protein